MKMSLESKKELIKKVKARYLKSNKKEKKEILNELGINTDLHRKYLITRLSAKTDLSYINPINRKRKEIYDTNVIYYLKKIWEIFDYPCGQRLEPMIKEYIDILEKFKEIIFPEDIKEKLLKIKSATIDRRLRRSKDQKKKRYFLLLNQELF